MDAIYSRLLVTDFAACFDFYNAVLPDLIGAKLVKGTAAGPYANWDVDDQAALVLFDRAAMAEIAGTTALPEYSPPARDATMFVCRVTDVDAGLVLCLRHGARLVAEAIDRPQWGAN